MRVRVNANQIEMTQMCPSGHWWSTLLVPTYALRVNKGIDIKAP